MSINHTQAALFRNLLDQIATDHRCTEMEAYQMHAYLFEQQLSFIFKEKTPLTDVASYLREMIVGQGFNDVGELLQYFGKEGEKMDAFLDSLPEQVVDKEVSAAELYPTEDIPTKMFTYLSPSGGIIKGSRRLYSRLSTIYVDNNNVLQETSLQDWSNDIYTTIRNYLYEQLEKKKQHTGKAFVFDFGDGCVIGRNYLQKFTGKKDDQVTVMAFVSDGSHVGIASDCDSLNEFKAMRNWVMRYYSGRQAPDYDSIINVVSREQTIDDHNFKAMLFEWLIFSKLFISHGCINITELGKDFLVDCYPVFNDVSTIYYSGHGFRAWLGGLFDRYLSRKRWTILKATQEQFWLTSDDPGFMISLHEWAEGMTAGSPDYSLAGIRTDTILYYPLTKEYCLRVEPVASLDDDVENEIIADKSIKFEQSSKGEVDFVNEMTVSTRREMVIGADRDILKQYKTTHMAKNGKTGDGHRNGPVKDRSQTHNPKTDKWVKRDTDTGRFMDGKSDDKPFKGVRKEK